MRVEDDDIVVIDLTHFPLLLSSLICAKLKKKIQRKLMTTALLQF